MKIIIQTIVSKTIEEVFDGFTEDLFKDLAPPLLPMNLLRFDGCKVDDQVHIELFLGQKWNSLITESEQTEKEIYFIDEGVKLPFPLSSWKHKHRLINAAIAEDSGIDSGTIISDEIEYSTGLKFFDMLLFPAFWLIFYYRKHIYKKKFC